MFKSYNLCKQHCTGFGISAVIGLTGLLACGILCSVSVKNLNISPDLYLQIYVINILCTNMLYIFVVSGNFNQKGSNTSSHIRHAPHWHVLCNPWVRVLYSRHHQLMPTRSRLQPWNGSIFKVAKAKTLLGSLGMLVGLSVLSDFDFALQ